MMTVILDPRQLATVERMTRHVDPVLVQVSNDRYTSSVTVTFIGVRGATSEQSVVVDTQGNVTRPDERRAA